MANKGRITDMSAPADTLSGLHRRSTHPRRADRQAVARGEREARRRQLWDERALCWVRVP